MNALYDKGREAFGAGLIDWVGDDIAAQLVDFAEYTPNLATDDLLADIPAPARVGAAQTLTGKTNVAGVMNAAAISVTGLTAAPTIEGIVLYHVATGRLIALIDTATGLPVSAGATQVDVSWNTGANKIFKL